MNRHGLLIVLLCVFGILSATGTLLWDACVPVVENDGLEYHGSGCQFEDGSTMIAWCKNVNGYRNIYVMRYDSAGQPVWTEPRIVNTDTSSQYGVSLKPLADGNIMLLWTRFVSYENWQSCVQIIDAQGSPVWEEPYLFGSGLEYAYFCIPDDEDGAYIVLNQGDMTGELIHLNNEGQPDWENGGLDLFGDMEFIENKPRACMDGNGGIIVAGMVYDRPQGDWYVGIQRVTPEGDTPWGDDGYILLQETENYDYVTVLRTGDNQFSLIHQLPCGDYDGIQIHRIDPDGQVLSQVSYDFGFSLDNGSSYTTDAVADQDGNIYIAWSETNYGYDRFSLEKITPDNQLPWDISIEGNSSVGNFRLSIAADGSLCHAWREGHLNICRVMMQRYDQDGNPQWETPGLAVAEGLDSFYGLNLFPIDDAMLVFWQEQREEVCDLCRQIFDTDGEPQLDENEIGIMRGYDFHPSNTRFADCDELPDRLAFTWFGPNWYFQTLGLDGAITAPYPGTLFFDNTENHGEVLAMEQIEDDYIIVWVYTENHGQTIHANRFDQAGNRLWQDDLIVYTNTDWFYPLLRVRMDVTDDEITIAWLQTAEYNYVLMAQKITGGQPAWTEPAVILDGLPFASYFIDIVDDYIIWNADGPQNRILRIDSDGSPYDGWDENGSVICSINDFRDTYVIDSSEHGLAFAWIDYYADYNTIYLQTISEDGAVGWEDGNPLHTDYRLYDPCIAFSEHTFFATWYTDGTLNDLYAMAFDMNGNPLWDEEHSAFGNIGGRICDIAPTPDGCLLVGSDDYSTENGRDIILQHIDFEGTLWDDLFYVCELPGGQWTPEIFPAQDNKYFITWEDYRNFVTYDSEIYAQLYRYEPLSTDDPTDIPAWEPDMKVYPNPFNPETTVRFSLPTDSNVDLKVYNVKGQLVRTLCDEVLPLGSHEITWDGTDNAKKCVSSGVYLIKLDIEGASYRKKVLLLK